MKKLIALCFSLFLFSLPAYAFSDISGDSELNTAVSALADYGVINGYSDNTFRPDNAITRAEMCKMINILFNFTDVGQNNFSDVSYEDWYYVQVLTAAKYEYIAGFEDGTFRGNNNLTREQACVIIDRITQFKPLDTSVRISDSISTWAKSAVQKMADYHLLQTNYNGRFRAKENITRGELALLLYHFIPVPQTESEEEVYIGTIPETAMANAVVIANLRAAVRDIESVTFNPNEREMVYLALIGMNGTIDAGINGTLITKNYVVKHFASEINASRKIYRNMSESEKGLFHTNLVKLNNSTLLFLQSYFLGDKSPV